MMPGVIKFKNSTMKIIYSLSTVMLILFSTVVFSQTNTTVTGTVLDENAAPLVSVTVLAINTADTSQRAITSTNGEGIFRFTGLTANATYHFRFTYVGYQDHSVNNFVIKQGENNSLLVRMQTAAIAQLEDVVVIGYGTQQKVNLTGAVNQVRGDDFRDRPVTNISAMLQGAVPNLNIRMGGGVPGQMGSLNV